MKQRFVRNKKGISTVLATLMMIVIAVAGSLVTYAWVMGYLNFTTAKAGSALQIQSVSLNTARTGVSVWVQNVGQQAVTLKQGSTLYINGVLITTEGLSADATLLKGATQVLTGTIAALPASPNNKLTIKVVAIDGTFAEATEYP